VKSNRLAFGFVVIGILCVLAAVLYYEGILQIFVTDSHAAHHTTHAILFAVLAVASFIAANFAREKVY
jgi:hypothetical protein